MSSARRIGLTGGIGSGKSTVAALLAALGAEVVDADALARACTAAGGAAIAPLVAAFGPACLDDSGALDRAAMRARVFQDPAARQRLEAIVHPLVRAAALERCAQTRSDCVVLDIPLLAESIDHWRALLDAIWVVDCSPETQIARVMARNGWSRAQVQAVLAAQASRTQRLALADVVIHNDDDPAANHAAGTQPGEPWRAALAQQVARSYAQQRQRFGL